MIMFKSLIAVLALAGFVAGCNTMEGAGQDIKQGGQKIEDSAQKHKDSN
jgi:entericidin B